MLAGINSIDFFPKKEGGGRERTISTRFCRDYHYGTGGMMAVEEELVEKTDVHCKRKRPRVTMAATARGSEEPWRGTRRGGRRTSLFPEKKNTARTGEKKMAGRWKLKIGSGVLLIVCRAISACWSPRGIPFETVGRVLRTQGREEGRPSRCVFRGGESAGELLYVKRSPRENSRMRTGQEKSFRRRRCSR